MWKAIVEFLSQLFSAKPEVADKEPTTEIEIDDPTQPVLAEVIETPEPKQTKTKVLPVLSITQAPNLGAPPADIMILQRRLKELGFNPGAVDGIYGSKTQAAVIAFQKSIKFLGSGKIGPKTLAALRLEVKASAKPKPTSQGEAIKKIPSTGVQGKGRKIEKELEGILDAKLAEIRLKELLEAIDKKDGNKIVWLANEALEAMRVREKTNGNDGHMVELIQETVGKSEKEPWCMAQQQSCIAYAETKLGIASKVIASESVMSTWSNSPKECQVKLENIQAGDIVIWQYGTSWRGHTGAVGGWLEKLKSFMAIEGNTSSGTVGSEIVREGGGTYKTKRSTGSVGTMHLRGFLRAF